MIIHNTQQDYRLGVFAITLILLNDIHHMNLETFYRRRAQLEQQSVKYRETCQICRQPKVGCYCAHITPFDTQIKFVILIHPLEERRRIATGRMSHLSLINSELISGEDFSNNERVNQILADQSLSPVILYPGKNALDISQAQNQIQIFQTGKQPVVFVIDGTWATARKMARLSQNLLALPKICFTPTKPSQFRVRKQPDAHCYSTIEAIHCSIELLSSHVGFSIQNRQHDQLLTVFNLMVENQIQFLTNCFKHPRAQTYRRPTKLIDF